MERFRPAILFALILILVVKTPSTYAAPDELVIITPIGSTLTDPVVEQFKVWYQAKTGNPLTVSFIRGGTPVLFSRIRTWAGKPDASIFWGGTPDIYEALRAENLLFAYKSPEFDGYPTDLAGIGLKHPGGYWYATSFFGLGVLYSGKLLRDKGVPVPSTWNDLLDPRYRGLITFTTPGKSGTMHSLVELFLQKQGDEKGWAYWRRVSVNLGKWSGRSFDVFVAVKQGEAAIGIAQAEEFGVRGILEAPEAEIGYTYLDLNTLVPSLVAILNGAPQLEQAKLFMDFMLSREAQLFSITTGFIPARPDVKFSQVEATSETARLMKKVLGVDSVWELAGKLFPLDFDLQSKRYGDVNKIFDETIFQVHDKLKAAWLAIEEAEARIKELQGKGYDATPGAQDVEKAKAAFDVGRYDEALSLATGAPEKVVATTVEALRAEIKSLQDKVASLEGQVGTLQTERLAYPVGAAIVAFLVGIAAGYRLRARKEE